MSAPRLTTWRVARLVAIANIVAIGVNSVVWAVAGWHLADSALSLAGSALAVWTGLQTGDV